MFLMTDHQYLVLLFSFGKICLYEHYHTMLPSLLRLHSQDEQVVQCISLKVHQNVFHTNLACFQFHLVVLTTELFH